MPRYIFDVFETQMAAACRASTLAQYSFSRGAHEEGGGGAEEKAAAAGAVLAMQSKRCRDSVRAWQPQLISRPLLRV